jgi:branched-chain amino acid transport system ATP-binding protein
MSTLLHTHALHAGYGLTEVLHGIDIEVPTGGVVAILGANGAGKTTLLRAILKVVRARGTVEFQGERIDGLVTEEIVRLGIGHVPDGRGTFTGLTVEDNLRLGAYTRRDRPAIAADTEQVFHYFPRLKERRRQLAGTLSGGEQQMLAVSRALMLRPRLLLLDEPSFGLAPKVVEEIFAIFRAIRQEQKVGILLVEQNAKLALELADFAYLLETGQVVLSGAAAKLKANDAVRNSYLGH